MFTYVRNTHNFMCNPHWKHQIKKKKKKNPHWKHIFHFNVLLCDPKMYLFGLFSHDVGYNTDHLFSFLVSFPLHNFTNFYLSYDIWLSQSLLGETWFNYFFDFHNSYACTVNFKPIILLFIDIMGFQPKIGRAHV